MKITTLILLASLSAFALPPLPPASSLLNISWTLSASDTTNGGSYTIGALPTNSLTMLNMVTITNVPSGRTNVWISPAVLPGNPCFIFAGFSTLNQTSAWSGPFYVDTNSTFAWQPLPAASLKVSSQ